MGSVGVAERGEHETEIHCIPGRPYAFRVRTVSAEQGKTKTDEKTRKGSDSLIIPMKPLIAVEGRGGDTDRSERQNIKHTGCEKKWKMRMTE